MISWWTDMESVALLNNILLAGTLLFSAITGLLIYLSAGKNKTQTKELENALDKSRKQAKTLEKAAESIRKELLEVLQHQDINQLKLETSTSSAAELRQELLAARKRLEIAEAAVKARKKKETSSKHQADVSSLELEPEKPETGLTASQRDHLIGLLEPGPKGNIDIICVLGDAKSELTAEQLDEILSNDGWKTNGVTQSAFSRPPKGIVLAVNSKETAPSYASFLQRVFSTIEMTVSAKIDSKFREWSLTVIVGAINES